MRRLAAQPNVEYVLHDLIVTADRLTLKPVIPATFSVIIGSTTQPETYDTFYTNSPQGWAVRQVGGYGKNISRRPRPRSVGYNHGPGRTHRHRRQRRR